MFGLFKKKANSEGKIAELLGAFESLSSHADEMYSDVGHYNPAEVRFFTMSAISVYLQSYGNLAEAEMQTVVGQFTEQAIASLILKMPKASYDMLHDAFVDRFSVYADMIVDLSNADDQPALQSALLNLMTTLDQNARVERDAFEPMLQGMKIVLPMTEAAASVRDALQA